MLKQIAGNVIGGLIVAVLVPMLLQKYGPKAGGQ